MTDDHDVETSSDHMVVRTIRRRHPAGGSQTSLRPSRKIMDLTWQVWLMGELMVSHTHQFWVDAQLGSRRARKLLALLAVDAGHVIPVDRIVDTLWPTEVPLRPAANVATLVSRLRATFDRHFITGGRQGYRLGEHVGNDLSAASELVTSAEAHLAADQPTPTRIAADQALHLMHDDVLPELVTEPWVTSARALRQRLRRRALQTSAEAALRAGDARAALVAAETAMIAEPFDEEACRLAMRACDVLDEPARALLIYDRLRLSLASDLGVDPAGPTQALYLSILRGRAEG
jgi:DNA-binding SARP family transcriptional activator